MTQLTVQQAFDSALRHHRAGRLQEAEQLYRQILAQEPQHAGAIHFLGVIAVQLGRNDVGIDLIRRALSIDPQWPDAWNNLGNALKNKGHVDEALAAYRKTIAIDANHSDAHNNIGNILADKGEVDPAITAYHRAIAVNPNHGQAYYNLGNVLKDKGRIEEAIAAYRHALALRANWPEAHNNLGNLLKDQGQIDGAIACYRQAVSLQPSYADAFINLAHAFKMQGHLDEAIAAARQVTVLKPEDAGAYSNLGIALADKGLVDEAIVVHKKAVALDPDLPQAHNNLANALKARGLPDEALFAYRQAIACDPNWPEAHNNLGVVLKDTGQLNSAIAEFRHALTLNPNQPDVHSNLIFAMHYDATYSAAEIAEEYRRWDQRYAEPLRKFDSPRRQSHPDSRDPDRCLNIGYVSPDMRNHAVGQNLVPLFKHHDHRQFKIICYAQVLRPDALTLRFQQNTDSWRNIVGVADEQLDEQIRQDQIDILVDLTLHSAHNRLLVFARKPAPVQVTFAGYPGSTGLTAMDYRLSDSYLDPPGMDESIYSEKTVRLPGAFWCYDPLEDGDVPVSSLPALTRGGITFGCLNNFCKINDDVLASWAQVMRQVDNSRLLLVAHEGSHRQRTMDLLLREGIDPTRVEFAPRQSRRAYLESYHRIDIGLDTFPYNGHTTSLDSFWMGVPVVTLVGQRAVSRAGWCQLSNLGFEELAAQTPLEFVRLAVELASDLPRLKQLRSTLRQRMEQSPLMDAPKFTRGIETAYRRMWRIWCQAK